MSRDGLESFPWEPPLDRIHTVPKIWREPHKEGNSRSCWSSLLIFPLVHLIFLIFIALAEHPLSEAQLEKLDCAFAHLVRDYSLLVNPESLSTNLFGPKILSSGPLVDQASGLSSLLVGQAFGLSLPLVGYTSGLSPPLVDRLGFFYLLLLCRYVDRTVKVFSSESRL